MSKKVTKQFKCLRKLPGFEVGKVYPVEMKGDNPTDPKWCRRLRDARSDKSFEEVVATKKSSSKKD